MQKYDVLIIGAGIAGCASAITLSSQTKLSVLVLDRAEPLSFKPGEVLSPGNLPLLNYLGLQDAFLSQGHIESRGIYSVWGKSSVELRDYFYSASGNGWHLNRKKFDSLLLEGAKNIGSSIRHKSHVRNLSWSENENCWTAEISFDGIVSNVETKYIIDATGRNSNLFRYWGAEKYYFDRLVGASAVVNGKINKSSEYLLNHTFIEAVEDGWWYLSCLPNKQFVVCFMCDANYASFRKLSTVKGWLEQIKKSEHIFDSFVIMEDPDKIHIVPAFSSCLQMSQQPNIIAVGDAVASFDPLSSTGISFGLFSGIEGARCIDAFSRSDNSFRDGYLKQINNYFQIYLNSRNKYYRLEQRWSESAFWRQRQLHLNIHPKTVITKGNIDLEAFDKNGFSSIFSNKLVRQVGKLCSQPIQTYQIASMIKKISTKKMTDHTIILGIQLLVESGFLRIVK